MIHVHRPRWCNRHRLRLAPSRLRARAASGLRPLLSLPGALTPSRLPGTLRTAARWPRRHPGVVATVLVGVLAVVSSLVSAPTHAEELRTLQTVQVQVGQDGTVTSITSTTVASDGSSGDRHSYDPSKAAADLPVRVRTAYRTQDSSGTDLADLAGYTGRVTIDVTVENLTVSPQSLTYDVAGTARTQTALVGVPLTLVASTSLGAAPQQVITAADDPAQTTNGVLSQGPDGTAQVQWAMLMAPPRLGATAHLRLVMDATNLTVPEISMAIYPGLVTDPSVQSLLDSAFRTDPGSALAQTSTTIEVLGQVNGVLANANAIVTKVRTNLDTNATTLASTTAADLASSSAALTSTMRSVGSTLSSLRSSLSSSLASTESTSTAQLLQVVNTVSALMGDTTQQVPTPTLEGTGCQAALPGPTPTAGGEDTASQPGATATPAAPAPAVASRGLYGSLAQVSAQLQAYAGATDDCKTQIQSSLLASIGPAEPDATTCVGQTSTTCALFSTQTALASVAQDLRQKGSDAAASLQPEVASNVGSAATTLSTTVDTVSQAAANLTTSSTTLSTDLDTLSTAASTLSTQVDTLVSKLDAVHSDVANATTHNTTATGQVTALADQLCHAQVPGATEAANLEHANTMRAYLTSTPCPGSAQASLPLPADATATLSDTLTSQATTLADASTLSDTKTEGAATATAVTSLRTAVTDVTNAVSQAKKALSGDPDDPDAVSLTTALSTLSTSVSQLTTDRTTLTSAVSALKTQQDTLSTTVTTAFDSAAASADAARTTVGTQVRLVSAQAQLDTATLGSMFERSTSALGGQAKAITDTGAQVVTGQNAQVQTAAAQAAAHVHDQAQASLSTMSDAMTSSVTDIEAARTLLSADLTTVLTDLGSKDGNGTGLIGLMSSSSALVGSANYQVALAAQASSAHAAVRGQDLAAALLTQAQVKASLIAQARMSPFHIEDPTGRVTTLYSIRIGDHQ